MEGSINVSSTVGLGSTFSFTLELTKCKDHILPIQGAIIKHCPSFQTSVRPQQNATRIILAEDNQINQLVGLRQLKKLGYENVHVASTGIEALEAWRKYRDSIILMDCQMPELDGYEVTRRIRVLELEENSISTPIIAMTASTMQGDRELCLAAGMDDYISKPVRTSELKEALEKSITRLERRSRNDQLVTSLNDFAYQSKELTP
jgi:CheY-like chemotaxis protein